MITVGLADDQQLFRAGIETVLSTAHELFPVWSVPDGAQAVAANGADPVDVVLMDVQMPYMDGLEATRRILAETGITKVVILTTFDDETYLLEAVGAGASGFLLKACEPALLIASIRSVYEGESVISASATAEIIRRAGVDHPQKQADHDLTPRELEVLRLMALGRTNTEICDLLVVGMPTVKTHINRLLFKIRARDRVQAVLYAFRYGLVTRGELLAEDATSWQVP